VFLVITNQKWSVLITFYCSSKKKPIHWYREICIEFLPLVTIKNKRTMIINKSERGMKSERVRENNVI